jgi:hypothetical protein
LVILVEVKLDQLQYVLVFVEIISECIPKFVTIKIRLVALLIADKTSVIHAQEPLEVLLLVQLLVEIQSKLDPNNVIMVTKKDVKIKIAK